MSCDIVAGRRPHGQDVMRWSADYQRRSGTTIETDNERVTDPTRETIYPDVEQDDPDSEGYTRL